LFTKPILSYERILPIIGYRIKYETAATFAVLWFELKKTGRFFEYSKIETLAAAPPLDKK
jgi:hypothetical protein